MALQTTQLRDRVIGILKDPRREWSVIAAEADDPASLYRNYIVVLAAIPAVSIFLGLLLFGLPLAGRWGFMAAVWAGVASYVSSLVWPLVAALVIERLAPKFGSTADTTRALKLVAYASTPVWVAGALYLLIFLSPLVVLAALYAIYLFYLGLPQLLRTPAEQVVPFMVVSALVIVVVNIVLRFVIGSFGLPSYF